MGSFCEYRSTDDVRQKKQKTKQNNSKQDLTTKGWKQYKYSALRYLQNDPTNGNEWITWGYLNLY